MDEAIGVNPAQGVQADPELAGVVGNDDRVRQKTLMARMAPHNATSVEIRTGSGVTFISLRPSPFGQVSHSWREAIYIDTEFVDHDLGQRSFLHVFERGAIDHVERGSPAQSRQESQPRFARTAAKHTKAVRADLRGVAVLAGMTGPVSSTLT